MLTKDLYRRGLIFSGVVLLLTLVWELPAQAVSACHTPPGSGNPEAEQYDPSQDFFAESGWYYTYNPYVLSITANFSLSHVYMQYQQNQAPFVEVGVYKGAGYNYNASAPAWYVAWWDANGYGEFDWSTPRPSVGSTYNYELLYDHDDVNHNPVWYFYWDGAYRTQRTIPGLHGALP